MSTICRPDIRSTSFQDRSESEFILPCGVQRAKRSSSFYIVNFDIYAATIPAKTEIHIVSKLVKCTCSPGTGLFHDKNWGSSQTFFFSQNLSNSHGGRFKTDKLFSYPIFARHVCCFVYVNRRY